MNKILKKDIEVALEEPFLTFGGAIAYTILTKCGHVITECIAEENMVSVKSGNYFYFIEKGVHSLKEWRKFLEKGSKEDYDRGFIGKEEMDWSDLEIVEKIRETYQENLKIKQ